MTLLKVDDKEKWILHTEIWLPTLTLAGGAGFGPSAVSCNQVFFFIFVYFLMINWSIIFVFVKIQEKEDT